MEEFNNLGTTKLFGLLSMEAKTYTRSQKSIKQISKSGIQKQANLPLKIFDYIYIAKCQ